MRPTHLNQFFKNPHGAAVLKAPPRSSPKRSASDLPCLKQRFGAFLIVPMPMTACLPIGPAADFHDGQRSVSSECVMTIHTIEYRGYALRAYSQQIFPPHGDPFAKGPK